jgi:hypothetical protein
LAELLRRASGPGGNRNGRIFRQHGAALNQERGTEIVAIAAIASRANPDKATMVSTTVAIPPIVSISPPYAAASPLVDRVDPVYAVLMLFSD